jgi:hypothetical protein
MHLTPTTDLRQLKDKTVLVKSSRDQRNPPAAARGTIALLETPGAAPEVQLVLDFPQMFRTRAHRRNIVLDRPMLERLLASEYNGTFELTVDEDLD